MMEPLYVKVKNADNVVVHTFSVGTEVLPGVTARRDIPQTRKIALTHIPNDPDDPL